MIVLRTIRRCLEKLKNKIDKILFCVEDDETFEKIKENMKIFFPRNLNEERFMSKFVPDVKENEYGDIIIPERTLEISSSFKTKKDETSTKKLVIDDPDEYIHQHEM